jgi:S1-C subfamily serine protease
MGWTLVLVAVLTATTAVWADPPGDLAVRQALHAASVIVEPSGCGGALAETPTLVVTAKHCIDKGKGRDLSVRFVTGARREARLVGTDDAADQVVLLLDDPVPIMPLAIVHRRQIPGTVLYFEGNPKNPRFQTLRIERIGVCPSLPDLPDALFTSLQGTPGDSGSPIVDAAARIVGLVHGGAQCQIATPSDTLARLVDRVLEHDQRLALCRSGKAC